VPEEIKRTFDKLGIPEAEQKYLAGVQKHLLNIFVQLLEYLIYQMYV
jgi:Fe-S cluster assembly scaffold protein SufB